ncbi:MAG: hypothetical protein Q4D77_02390 [Peptostreptococcaceae bacterium]|nr:hypothetical protein [Peptostreptococcaceae bacterium]
MIKLEEAAKRLREAIKAMDECVKSERDASGVYAWNYSGSRKRIEMQMDLILFMREFGRGELIERTTPAFPYQVEAERDGIIYFSLLDQREYQTYMEEVGDNEKGENTGLYPEIA